MAKSQKKVRTNSPSRRRKKTDKPVAVDGGYDSTRISSLFATRADNCFREENRLFRDAFGYYPPRFR